MAGVFSRPHEPRQVTIELTTYGVYATMLDMAEQLEQQITWRDLAACVDTKIDFFDLGSNQRQERLLEYCKVCDVRQECLDYAIWTNQSDGVWGGMRPDERKKQRRRVMDARRKERRLAREFE